MVSFGGINEANLTFGPGCAILSYCAISYAMEISGEEASDTRGYYFMTKHLTI